MGTRAHAVEYHTDGQGNVLTGTTVNVYQQGTTTPIVETIYQYDSDHASSGDTLSNPLTTDSSGKIEFYLASPKRVDLKFTKAGYTVITRTVDVTRTPNDGAAGADGADGADGAISLLRDGGTDKPVRGKINFVDSAAISFTLTDDAGNDETEVTADFVADMATQAELNTVSTSISDHIADTSDAHDASAISIADAGNDFTATDVEGALAELQSDHEADSTALSDHLADTSDAHDASAISFSPTGSIAATDVQAAIAEVASEAGGGAGPTIAVKTADETVTSSTTLQSDDHLTFAIGANETWIFELLLIVSGSTAGDLAMGFTFPSSPTTFVWGLANYPSTSDAYQPPVAVNSTTPDVTASFGLAASVRTAIIRGTIINGANAGNVTLRWAQLVSDGTGTTIRKGSHLIAHEVV